MNTTRILVWDIPTRVFHWLLAISFAGAYVTAESEAWRLVHVTLGYTFGGLILFRLLWGLVGTRHARFSDFAFGPRRVLAYLRSLLGRNPEHHVGHNPAGSWAIYAILLLGLGTALSGYALYNEIGGEAFEDVHEVVANLLLGIVVVHIAGVIVSSVLHRINLPRSMVTGYKTGEATQGIQRAHAGLGIALAGLVLAFWANAFGVREALVGAPIDTADTQSAMQEQDHDDDD
ncbi:cytochrome b/b6 domain-containing protein [Fontimonas sp. SYSU GA230001]|uniref:cytochrome b/b6 domain-containing protein n=1 Tax=Fontimonas sp. SYSU GA230001 TaxID=3142450 RepID=UPI0032B4D141